MKKLIAMLAVLGVLPSIAQAQLTLDLKKRNYTSQQFTINGQSVPYRAYKDIVYVDNPVDTGYQSLNIFIPEAYFHHQSVDGYTAETAPIFFPAQGGGFMPAKAKEPGHKREGSPVSDSDTMKFALSKGYVVVSAGVRGRTQPQGKAPAAIVDMKAAIRYLHYNDAVMPGDAQKIIANGTSGGAALAVLLGASGNQKDFEPYLKKLGAAPARDDVFAVSAYAPISILDHADAAYEWQFNGVNHYQKIDITMLDYHVKRTLVKGELDTQQQALSEALKQTFPEYLNSLGLTDEYGQPLTLDKSGNGSFKNYIATYIQQSAQQALDKGEDLSAFTWLKVKNGKVQQVNFDEYAKGVGRQKTPPAFDDVNLSAGENQLFGTDTEDKRHFTAFSMQHNMAPNASIAGEHTVQLMNPMTYISQQTPTQHWRIRVGTNDRDTSLAISAILATKLRQMGKQVDYALPWNRPHSGDYDLDELFAWIKQITR